MRAWPCQLAALGLLLMGFEGVMDLTVLADAAGEHAHAGAAMNHAPGHDGADEDEGTGADPDHHHHCGHTCHGHVTNVGVTAFVLHAPLCDARQGFDAPHPTSRVNAPPTPPPNA